jgi:hypothetical protein
MKTLYQIINDQFEPEITFLSLDDAKRYIATLQETYDSGYYVVELPVVYFKERTPTK